MARQSSRAQSVARAICVHVCQGLPDLPRCQGVSSEPAKAWCSAASVGKKASDGPTCFPSNVHGASRSSASLCFSSRTLTALVSSRGHGASSTLSKPALEGAGGRAPRSLSMPGMVWMREHAYSRITSTRLSQKRMKMPASRASFSLRPAMLLPSVSSTISAGDIWRFLISRTNSSISPGMAMYRREAADKMVQAECWRCMIEPASTLAISHA